MKKRNDDGGSEANADSFELFQPEEIKRVEGVKSTKSVALSPELKAQVEQFTPMQKRYAEYRSKGLRQADAAQKGGSRATGRAALGRVGYQWEQLLGMKEYIAHLYEKRARASIVDEIEIIEKLRANYDLAIEEGRVDWANKTLELMGALIGAFHAPIRASTAVAASTTKTEAASTGGVSAFKPEGEEQSDTERLKLVNNLVKAMSREAHKGE